MSIKSIGYAIGMIGILFQGLDQIESEHDKILQESAQRYTEALRKVDSDTYGIYRMLKVGFGTTSDPIEIMRRQRELEGIFKIYEVRYIDKAKEGIREAQQIAAEANNGFLEAAKSVLKIGYSITLVGALIIGFCEYEDSKRERNRRRKLRSGVK